MARRAVAWLLAGAMLLVVLLLASTAFVAPPTAGGLRTGDPPRDAQPAASAAAGATDGEPSSAERAPVASPTITVSGRIVGAKDRGVVWLGERRELGFARFTAEDGFAVRCARPLAQVRLRAI